MKKKNKIVIIAFALLILATLIVYAYSHPNIGTENSIIIRGAVSNPETLTFSQIEAFSPTTLNLTLNFPFHLADNGTYTYTGAALILVLDQAKVFPNATSIFVQAPDGYAVTLSIQEAQKATTILAYQKNGAPMTPLSTGEKDQFD